MATLYRKYRPRNFTDIAGQEHVTKTLQAALKQKRIAHAYLFYGARGTGKTTTARVLAENLGARGLDVLEIDAASNRGIDDIRSLRDSVALSPTQGKYKVYIIDEVHMLTKEAFAALLKTLEEPVAHAVFILATTELHKVPATIVSRCQVYRFRRASDAEMRQRLTWILTQEKRALREDALQFLIARSDGCYRDAESLLGQVLTWREGDISAEDLATFLGLPERELLEQFIQGITRSDAKQALATIDTVYNEGIDPDQFLQEAIRLARDTAVSLTKGETAPAFASAWAGKPALEQVLSRLPIIIRALLQALQDLAYVPEPRIALQLAVLSVCQTPAASSRHPVSRSETPPPRKVAAQPRASTPSPRNESRNGDVQKVKKVWSELISQVKTQNPVASTFLRAIEPIGWNNDVVTVRVQYALHRNFFDKPENKKIVEATLGKLLKTEITVRYQLEEPSLSSGISASAHVRQKEEDLYQTVKEVFAEN